MKNKLQRVLAVLILGGVVLACGMGGSTTPRQATLDAISASVRGTATAVAAQEANPDAALETAQAQATERGGLVAATQTAEASLSADARTATAAAFAPVLAELPKYGVDPAAGHVGWVHPPVSLEVNGYLTYDYINHFIATVATDFVVSADITWNTQYGTSGCGFVLRSDGNEAALNQYMAILTRGATGHLLFAVMSEGDIVGGRDIYAYGRDPNFNWENGATNQLTIVGRGNVFSIYSNATLIGEIDPSKAPGPPSLPDEPDKPNGSDPLAMAEYQALLAEHDAVVSQITADYAARQREAATADKIFERGFIAMVVLSESGRTQCQFDNGWLWLID
ncbi:MAG: hypothetical protein AB1649_02185 [Chloroflexota bacterium]